MIKKTSENTDSLSPNRSKIEIEKLVASNNPALNRLGASLKACVPNKAGGYNRMHHRHNRSSK